jgi:ATP-dependent RNA helicase DeaD
VEEQLQPGDAPEPPSGFDPFPLSAATREALRTAGFSTPLPAQEEAFAPIREGRDVIIQARTGTGKTLAFALPLVDGLPERAAAPLFLVLAPTRELAAQNAAEIQKVVGRSGVRVALVYGGVAIEPQMAQLRQGVHAVVGTPGRVLDLFDRMPAVTRSLRTLVLDEVDEMLSMGFERDVEAVVQRFPGRYQGVFLSATLPPAVARLAERYLREPALLHLSDDGISPPEIRHLHFLVDPVHRLRDLIRILDAENPIASFIFCNTRDDAQMVASRLCDRGIPAELLSGELTQAERNTVMQRVREGKVVHLVATDVAARGLDVLHLTHVINYQFPQSLEIYVHRTGRVGRLGQTGTAISLVGPQDVGNLYFLRLTYGIQPIERSLPSDAEIAREREAAQVRALAARYGKAPPDGMWLGLLRRVLTHVEGERILANVLGEHLDADRLRGEAEAEAVRRRQHAVRAAEARGDDAEPAPRPERGRTRAAPIRASAPEHRGPSAVPAGAGPEAEGSRRRRRRRRPEEDRPGEAAPGGDEPRATPDVPADDAPPSPPAVLPSPIPADLPVPDGRRLLQLNVGAEDGVDGDFLAQWLRARLGLASGEIAPVEVRGHDTLLGVPSGRIEEAGAALGGLRFGGRDVVAREAPRG